MTIQRNLNSWVQGDAGREMVRRTIDEMDKRLGRFEQMITNLAKSEGNGNGRGLTARQQADVLALVAGRSSAVIGQETVDPLVVGLPTGNGTVTNFSAGDFSPLFTTNETTPTTTPALTFVAINQNANLFFAGPSSGAAAAPAFRSLTAADLQLISVPLLSSTILNLNTNTKQSLGNAVPAGKSMLPMFLLFRNASTDLTGGATTILNFGFNAGATDWSVASSFPLAGSNLRNATKFCVFSEESAAGSATCSTVGIAGDVFGGITDAAFGSPATVVVDVYGNLF